MDFSLGSSLSDSLKFPIGISHCHWDFSLGPGFPLRFPVGVFCWGVRSGFLLGFPIGVSPSDCLLKFPVGIFRWSFSFGF